MSTQVSALAGLVDRGLVAPDWAEALAPVDDRIAAMGRFLRAEVAAGRGYQPAGDLVFRAFRRPLADVRVLVVGQYPYPNPTHPIGLSFAVERHVWPLPPSLVNIYAELEDDLGIVPPRHGDLSAWADQGVMLLNRVLTVRPGESASHRGRGWEEVTDLAIRALVARWTGESEFTIDQLLRDMIGRSRVLKLRVPGPDDRVLLDFAGVLAVRSVHFLYRRRESIPL